MEDGSRANLLSAAFPAPPPFYKHFTPDNIAQLKAARNATISTTDAKHDDSTDESGQILTEEQLRDLPRELLYLIPPEPPKSGLYQCFGEALDVGLSIHCVSTTPAFDNL